MKKLINYFESDDNHIICHYNDRSTRVLSKTYENTKKLLDKMEEEHLEVRESIIDKVNRYDKYKVWLVRSSFVLFALGVLSMIISIISGNFISIPLLLLSKSAAVSVGLSIISFLSGILVQVKSDLLFNNLDKKDFVLNNEDVLNSAKSVEVIRNINSKLFKIMQSNKYRLLPSLNINTAKYLDPLDVKVLEEELGIDDREESIFKKNVDTPTKYDTKIIEFRRK